MNASRSKTRPEMGPGVKHAYFRGKLVMVGFGCIGQAILPLLLRHIDIRPDQIAVIASNGKGASMARACGIHFSNHALTPANHVALLEAQLSEGDFLLNLSVDVSSLALMTLCRRLGALYLDTCIEPWAGGYTDSRLSLSERSNYALRESVLAFGDQVRGSPTAVVTQGANPGLASSFVKQALLNMATDTGLSVDRPADRAGWAALSRQLGIKAIHIAERDSQMASQTRQRDEFVNTWSAPGFIAEGTQPSELGWGTHERHWPPDGERHAFGCDAAIYLDRPGLATRVRSWTPLQGAFHGFLVTHGESISIADHLSCKVDGVVVYRPTVHYAYQPCDDTLLSIHDLASRNWHAPPSHRLLRDDIVSGIDELGVLLMGNPKGVYWYGSRLSIQEARRLAPFNSATSLQVAAGALAGVVWALRHRRAGVVEPDDLDHEMVLHIAGPYLGELVGVYGDWSPLQGRGHLFKESMDTSDPWQFKNVRVC